MRRSLLPLSFVLATCTPSPQKAAMPSPSPASGATGQSSPGSGPQTDSPAEALGRRILSTAFVRIGPDGHLTVELHGGRVMVLRNVVMRPTDYCGVQVGGDPPVRAKYCGGYAEVAAARPGGAPAPATIEPAPGPPKGR